MGDVELAVRPSPPDVPGGGGPQRRQSNTHSIGAYSRRGGDDLTVAVWSLGGPLGLTLFAGVVEAAAAINLCAANPVASGHCSGLFGYAVALGVLSSILIAIYLLIFTFARDRLFEKSMMYLSAFLFLWWTAGVGATTFTTTTVFFAFAGTMYFSTWCAFFFSGMIMYSEWEQFRDVVSTMKTMETSSRSTFYLLLASLVETISAAFVCGSTIGGVTCNGQSIYALIVGLISMFLCILLLKVDVAKFRGSDKAIALFLVLWWSVAMGFLYVMLHGRLTILRNRTIAGPFIIAGNGFFSTWAAFFASFFVAQSRIFPHSPNLQQ